MATYAVTTNNQVTVTQDGSEVQQVAGVTYMSDVDALAYLRASGEYAITDNAGNVICEFRYQPTPAEQIALDAQVIQVGPHMGLTVIEWEVDVVLSNYSNHPHVLGGCGPYTTLQGAKTRVNMETFLAHIITV